MHSPQAPNLQDTMDERGLMIVAEIPVWGQGDPQVFFGQSGDEAVAA